MAEQFKKNQNHNNRPSDGEVSVNNITSRKGGNEQDGEYVDYEEVK